MLDLLLFLGIPVISRFYPWLTIKIVLVGLVILDGVTIMLDLLLFLGILVLSRFYLWLYYKDCSSRFGHSGWCNYNAGSAFISWYPSYIKILPLVTL